jgi:hypothetical protein
MIPVEKMVAVEKAGGRVTIGHRTLFSNHYKLAIEAGKGIGCVGVFP